MKVLFVTLLVIAGAFARSAVQDSIFAEGPACPIADPLNSPGPSAINVTLHPLFQLLEGCERGDLVATGLSTLHYNIDINALLLTASFEVTITQVGLDTTYTNAEGYVDARPLGSDTVPAGNFTGSGTAKLTASGVHAKGRGSLWINIIGNKVTLNSLTLEIVNFDTLTLDLGATLTIGGSPVDWATWSQNIKANFDRDFAANKNEVVDKVRLAANNIIGQYTLAELIELIGGGGGGGEEPCETNP